jgi:ankyrin repeat protein
MVKSPLTAVTAALLAGLGAAAMGQGLGPTLPKELGPPIRPPVPSQELRPLPADSPPNGAIAPTNIVLPIPPVSQAILDRDIRQVSSELEKKRESVNERVRAKDGERAGFTPLILAAAISDPEIAQALIKYGAAVTALDDYHRSAFWYAALREDVTLTDILASAPGSKEVVNAADDDLKRTPLHIAVRGDEPDLVQHLLKLGATKELRDILGETPVDFCKRRFTGACKALN